MWTEFVYELALYSNTQCARGLVVWEYDSGSHWEQGGLMVRSTELDAYLEGSEFDPRLDLCKNVSCSQVGNVTSTKDKELWKYEEY
jgi:hypothetical protein